MSFKYLVYFFAFSREMSEQGKYQIKNPIQPWSGLDPGLTARRSHRRHCLRMWYKFGKEKCIKMTILAPPRKDLNEGMRSPPENNVQNGRDFVEKCSLEGGFIFGRGVYHPTPQGGHTPVRSMHGPGAAHRFTATAHPTLVSANSSEISWPQKMSSLSENVILTCNHIVKRQKSWGMRSSRECGCGCGFGWGVGVNSKRWSIHQSIHNILIVIIIS